MKIGKDLNESERKRMQKIILSSGIFTTLAIWTNLEDPINLPKMFTLVLFAAIIFGLILRQILNYINILNLELRIAIGIFVVFAFGLFFSTLATDVKFVAIFGEYHRNNGALSVISALIIFIAAIFSFQELKSEILLKTISILGLALSIYGFFQYLGHDLINWHNQYNPLITTLGNPNFTSGFLGISAIATTYLAIINQSFFGRTFNLFSLVMNLFVIIKSDSSQGFFVFIFGAGIVVVARIYLRNQKLGILFSTISALAGSFVVAAIFNVGPLASRLYQSTLRNRLDYWNAAINMFQSNPLFGVGIDRYGEYYRQYAVQNQFSQGVFTSNAHNIYLQFLSTGGLILFIPYLILICFVSWCAFRLVKLADRSTKLYSISLLALWVSFLTMNLITIDNLGVGIWFWIIGGSIVGLYSKNSNLEKLKQTSNNKRIIPDRLVEDYLPKILAFVFALSALYFTLPSVTASNEILVLKSINKNSNDPTFINNINLESLKYRGNPQILTILADLALQNGNGNTTLEISRSIRAIDSRSYYGNYFPILVYEGTNRRNLAIPFREKLLVFDKWNTGNMVELVKSYLDGHDYNKAKFLALKLNDLNPESEDSKKAQALIENLKLS